MGPSASNRCTSRAIQPDRMRPLRKRMTTRNKIRRSNAIKAASNVVYQVGAASRAAPLSGSARGTYRRIAHDRVRRFPMLGRLLGATALWTVAVFWAGPSTILAKQTKHSDESIAKAEKATRDKLAALKGTSARVEFVKDDAVTSALPNYYIFSVLFPRYPVARRPPSKDLTASNLFAVDDDGKVTILKDAKELEKFFQTNVTAKSEEQKKRAIRSWLRLAQQYHQDGFYTFRLMDDATKVDGNKVSGVVVAMKGGSGMLKATLTFDDDGKLDKVQEEAALRPGPRPICQASKLLDPDPLIRRIVEQDLLLMGVAAKDYLDEQRAKASPELQRAIDRMWQR